MKKVTIIKQGKWALMNPASSQLDLEIGYDISHFDARDREVLINSGWAKEEIVEDVGEKNISKICSKSKNSKSNVDSVVKNELLED